MFLKKHHGIHKIFLLFVVSLFLLTAVSCCRQKQIKVEEVKFADCVPNKLFVDYVEQMKYLAMKDQSENGKEKKKAIIEIEHKVNEAQGMLEKYRRIYAYGDCDN